MAFSGTVSVNGTNPSHPWRRRLASCVATAAFVAVCAWPGSTALAAVVPDSEIGSGIAPGTSPGTVPNRASRATVGTVVFSADGTLTVPAGVTDITVKAWGAGGGGGGGSGNNTRPGGAGGGGGFAQRSVTVNAGDTLVINVGRGGAGGVGGSTNVVGNGGGGGGYSRVQLNASTVLIAGGGGGGGGADNVDGGAGANGGGGGGASGQVGANGVGGADATGGGGGTSTTGGAGGGSGATAGLAGASLSGGRGGEAGTAGTAAAGGVPGGGNGGRRADARPGGGGGGGGLFGGGGGRAAHTDPRSAAGGGGGSGFAPGGTLIAASGATPANTADASYALGRALGGPGAVGGGAGAPRTGAAGTPGLVVVSATTDCSVSISGLATHIGNAATDNTYQLWGELNLANAPSTGQLYVRVLGGPSRVYDAPFPSSLSFEVPGLYADGAARNVQAVFSANPFCASEQSFTAPLGAGPILELGYTAPTLQLVAFKAETTPNFRLPGASADSSGFGGAFNLAIADKSLTNHAGFCVELAELIGQTTYSSQFVVQPLEFSTRGRSGFGPSFNVPALGIGRVQAGKLRYLFDTYYLGTNYTTDWTSANGAAFQLALWDIVQDHFDGSPQTINSGSSPTGFFRNGGTPTAWQTEAEAMLQALNALSWTNAQWESYASRAWHPIFLESAENSTSGSQRIQDLITAVPLVQSPDFGDLPAPFPTTLAQDGARHIILSESAFLGQRMPDPDANGQPSSSADGDNTNGGNDEDGVLPFAQWTPGSASDQDMWFRVTIGRPGHLSMFIDSNLASPSGLQRATLLEVEADPPSLATVSFTAGPQNFFDILFPEAGEYWVRVNLPGSATGSSIATRWRITNGPGQGGQDPTGLALNGEVEDHIFTSDQGVPVVLAWVESERVGDRVRVRWATASEVGNVGFRLLDTLSGRMAGEALVESTVIDSTEPSFYESVVSLTGDLFFIEDVDIFGQPTRHGPFRVGSPQGSRPELEPIDWAQIHAENVAARSPETWGSGIGQSIQLETDAAGVHRLHHADLLAAGIVPGGVAVSDIALTLRGQPVPFHSSSNGWFGEQDWIEFVAEPSTSLYSAANIYQLHLDRPQLHQRVQLDDRDAPAVAAVDRHIETARIGQPRRYSFSAPTADPWFDTQMTVQDSPRSWDFDFEVNQLLSGQGSARLRLTAWGVTHYLGLGDDHHLQVLINLEPVADLRFEGRTLIDLDLDFDASLLNDGANLLTLVLPGVPGVEAGVVAFQKASIDYPRALLSRNEGLAFDAAGERIVVGGVLPQQPLAYRLSASGVSRLSVTTTLEQLFRSGFEASSVSTAPSLLVLPGDPQTGRYLLVDEASLSTPRVLPGRAPVDLLSGSADYLVISHPLFISGVQPLLDFHSSRGRTVRVVDVRDIHAQYSGGFPEGQGIQAFLREAAGPVGYSHVLLVGGDTYDYRGYLSNASVSYVPTVYTASGDLVTHMPADALLVDLNGNGAPDRAIGRLPVRTASELAEVVQKTLDYAQRSYRGRMLLAADEAEPGRSYAGQAETLRTAFGANWSVQRAFLDQLAVADARQTIIDGLNLGQSLLVYTGHSAPAVWTFKGLFAASDVNSLSPLRRPTVVAQWGCWNTYHVSPNYNTMGHRFMLASRRGAAAVMGSATFTNAASSAAFVDRLGSRLSQPGLTLGEAVLQAKQLMDASTDRDIVLGWTILGDPAIVIND